MDCSAMVSCWRRRLRAALPGSCWRTEIFQRCRMMKILVNGAWRNTDATDIAAALHELGYDDAVVATALNGQFVPAGSRTGVRLAEGDRLEVLAPMQGG